MNAMIILMSYVTLEWPHNGDYLSLICFNAPPVAWLPENTFLFYNVNATMQENVSSMST